MSFRETLDTFRLCWFSKPKAERPIYKFLRQHPARSILELGLNTEERTLSLIRLMRRLSPGQEIRYVGIDLFDARPNHLPRLTLKQIHQVTQKSGAAARLIPGDAISGMVRCVNQIQNIDLVIISADQDVEQMSKAWSHMPRILSPQGTVFLSHGKSSIDVASVERLTSQQMEALAAKAQKMRRAA